MASLRQEPKEGGGREGEVVTWGLTGTGVHLVDCFDICHTSLNKQMLKCSSETIRKKIFFFSPEIFSIQEIDILYWQFYKTDVNVLKFLAYLIQFNLIKPNCPLKCRYENCLVLVVHSDVQIVALCPTNLKNWDLYLTFYSKAPPVHSVCPTKSLPSSVNIRSNIFRPAWQPLLMMAG